MPDWMIREQPEYIQWLAQRATQVAGVPTTSAQAQQSVAAWTFMVYMAADNDLEGFAVADINEMEFVGSTEGVNVIVQVDRAELYDTSNEDWTEARRYFITRDTNLSQIASEQVGDKIGETNTGDPESLIDFVTWTAETYPAERYALIIWDHGGSWLGVATDESAEYDDLTLPELDQALQAITQDSNLNQFELIGFDACLMGGFEVYRTISPYSRYAVASAELIPGNGWDYLGILDTLAAGPSLDGAGLGQGIIDSFIYFYTEVVTNYETFNLTLVDLAQSDHVLDAFESLYNVVENDPTTALEAINRARSQTPEFGAFDDPQFVDFWSAADLLEFMQLLSQQVPGTPLGDAANDVYEAGRVMTLYYRGQADAPESNGGVSIFFPRNITLYRQGDRDERYTAEAPVSLSLWQAFLGTFYETAAFASNLATLEGTVEGVSAEDDQALIELGFGSSTISQAAFIVTLDLGNGQSIVIDYSRLTNFEEGETVTWSGDVPWLTNGDTEVPVLVLRSRRDPNVGIVNGKVYRKDGSSIQAQVVFDLTTNRATSVWGFRRTVGTIMPYELHPTAEDIFHPYWLVLGPGNFLIPTPANQQLVFGTEPLYLIWKGASAGAYQIILQLEDAAGNTQQDDLTVVVEGGDDLVLDEVDTGSDDYDQDSILNVNDNCPVTFNPDQADEDDDGVGDVCDLFDDIDTDGDGVPNDQDNCPATYNPNQADSDNDGVGNVCEALSDGDGDGIPDDSDNCLTTYNPYQVDQDGDGIGDDCDPLIDSDNDGIADNVDNCPTVPNPDQADSNGDGTGNACETGTDSDNDGLPDSSDNCPYFYNPDQADSDSDGVGDVCDSDTDTDSDGIPDNTDNCPTVYNPTQQDSDGDGVGDACDTGADSDGDGVGDLLDNCPAVSNPGQQNTDGDTQGDECDNDDDNDGALDGLDNCQFIANPGQQDVDLDGVGDACDGFVNPILGDRVWHDINANGLQDAGELGLSNVTVNLYTQGGTLTATEITDVNGLYQFTGMPAGSYFLEFRPRPSYFISPRDLGSDSQDSDPRPTNGRTNVFTLVEGGNNAAFDAGMYMNAAVGDLVWNDADANGIQDGGEPGLSGLTVTLYSAAGTVIDTTTSDASGGYRFAELVPGSYYLRFSAPSANDFSPQNQGADDTLDSDVDSSGQTTPFTLISGEINPTLDAGQYEISKISNRVWLDENGNGIQDTGEDNLSGTNVTLYRSGGTFVASDTTDSSGHYLMDRLPPGSYYLQFAALSGHVFTLQDQGADDTADSDANSSGQTAVFTFPQGTDDTTRDAGMYVPVEVQGRVWEDMDADGIQDAGEPDLSGVTVQLWSGGPTLVGTQTTLADGSYTFTGLRPGLTYHVQVYTFGAYLFSPQNQGGNDALDSDANLSTGETASVTPVSGATVDFDAGMYRLVEIGGLVWHDLNADGVQAGGEPALSGITVRLWNGGTLLNTQTTLAGGDYNFG
ncbi:MAG: thrombospondin type 3 repeat-containing protein, partial [Chloroflexi bacterium]|nr:thrombospondin type 3 repeat-containing protein [Chloroflexota bacterium]